MLTLYYSPGTASLVVHWLLIELDVVHELRFVDFDAIGHGWLPFLPIDAAAAKNAVDTR